MRTPPQRDGVHTHTCTSDPRHTHTMMAMTHAHTPCMRAPRHAHTCMHGCLLWSSPQGIGACSLLFCPCPQRMWTHLDTTPLIRGGGRHTDITPHPPFHHKFGTYHPPSTRCVHSLPFLPLASASTNTSTCTLLGGRLCGVMHLLFLVVFF